MKKIFAVTFLLTISHLSSAQEQPMYAYCEIICNGPSLLSNKVTIKVDFGQEKKSWILNEMKDAETGKPLKFNSRVDALNFLGSQGWELVQVFTVPFGESFQEYHYVLKRKVEELEEVENQEE